MSELDTLREANLRMRDMLLSFAKECKACGGTGCTEEVVEHPAWGPQVQTIPCESCYDLRAILE